MGDPAYINQVLLQEAQAEVSKLRTELHVARRFAEERRQAEQSLLRANEGLRTQVSQLQEQLSQTTAEANQVPTLQQQAASLQQLVTALQKELDMGVRARRILESELATERHQRAAVEESKASLQAERAHLLKAKDDLTATLRVAQRKVVEAEEEQIRAEDEAAGLRKELKALQSALHDQQGAPPSDISDLGIPVRPGARGGHSRHPSEYGTLPTGMSTPQTQQLLDQVEEERGKAAMLMASLHEAKSENVNLQHEVEALTATTAHLKHQVVQLEGRLTHALAALEEAAQQSADPSPDKQQQQQQSQPQSQQHGPVAHANDHVLLPNGMQVAQGLHPSGSRESEGGAPIGMAGRSGNGSGGGGRMDQGSDSRGREEGSVHGGGVMVAVRRIASSSGVSEVDSNDHVGQLQLQVIKLKASRDKLLEQIDRQWEEMDRLASENRGLSETVERLEHIAMGWEAQAQGSLAAEERLKEMLEEAAAWGGIDRQTAGAGQGAGAGKAAGGGHMAQGGVALESELLSEKGRVAELELQVRALAAELLRAQQASMAFGKAVLPTLSGVEHRLTRMCEAGAAARRQLQGLKGHSPPTSAVPVMIARDFSAFVSNAGAGAGSHTPS